MKRNKKEYYEIYSEFYNINKYREMKSIVHHGNNRLSHINRVAKLSFYTSKILKFDVVTSTRGALMHDFFVKEDISKMNYKKFLENHPKEALLNSKKYFKVNKVEEDIIVNHMFPLTHNLPKYKESYLVSLCDKVVSIYEFLRFEINLRLNLAILFIINYISF